MKLICHPLSGDAPPIRPASQKRQWMDDTPEAFAYRCLPLVVANQHGWEVVAPHGLTARQREVLEKLVKGCSNKAIARALDLSEGTIKFHLSAVFRILGAVNRVEAATAGARLLERSRV